MHFGSKAREFCICFFVFCLFFFGFVVRDFFEFGATSEPGQEGSGWVFKQKNLSTTFGNKKTSFY